MGIGPACSSSNKKEKNITKEVQKNNHINNDKNNQLCIPQPQKQKENIDQKKLLKNIITNISQNSEYDETEELDLNYLDEYIDSIFPNDFPKEYIDSISSQIYEIKKYEVGGVNNIVNKFEFKQIDNQRCFIFICSMKKVTENTVNIAYKFKIVDISTQKLGIEAKEIFENKENQPMIKSFINEEYQKLNQKV